MRQVIARVQTRAGELAISRAELADIPAVVDIMTDAAEWLRGRGIDMWHIDREQTSAYLQAALTGIPPAREVYLAWRAGPAGGMPEPVGTLALQATDPRLWGEQPDDALYLHSFAVRRVVGGQGVGRALLRWAESFAAGDGKSYLRLDCVTENPALRTYYERAGYIHRGELHGTTWSASLYERRVDITMLPLPTGDTLAIAQAAPTDLAELVAIEEDAVGWVRSRGIDPGNPPRPLAEIFADIIARGQMLLASVDGHPAAKLALTTAEEKLWADLPGDALYVHGLMVRRAFAGRQIGLGLLGWAAEHAAALGKPLLRLDCMANNPALRAYYERAGLAHRGDVTLPHRVAARYERSTI
jgi:GNAT superfamily N-acetyltransferase